MPPSILLLHAIVPFAPTCSICPTELVESYVPIDKEAKEYLADIGYDEVYGARELGRVIQEKVKKPMAEELIFGALSKGGHVDIKLEKGEISFKYSSNQDKKKELV